MRDAGKYACDARKDGSKTDNGVQGRDHLRELDGSDATSDDTTNATTHGSDYGELDEGLCVEPNCSKGRKNTRH